MVKREVKFTILRLEERSSQIYYQSDGKLLRLKFTYFKIINIKLNV